MLATLTVLMAVILLWAPVYLQRYAHDHLLLVSGVVAIQRCPYYGDDRWKIYNARVMVHRAR